MFFISHDGQRVFIFFFFLDFGSRRIELDCIDEIQLQFIEDAIECNYRSFIFYLVTLAP